MATTIGKSGSNGPLFPSKPVLPQKVSQSSYPSSNFSTGSKPVSSTMQMVGIGLLVVGLILLAIGIMTWK